MVSCNAPAKMVLASIEDLLVHSIEMFSESIIDRIQLIDWICDKVKAKIVAEKIHWELWNILGKK